MAEHTCAYCAGPFVERTNKATYCSIGCRHKARRRRTGQVVGARGDCPGCGASLVGRYKGTICCSTACSKAVARNPGRPLPMLIPINCRNCGKQLPDQRGTRGKKRLCSDDCRRDQKNDARRAEGFTIQCVVCHASAETSDTQQRYCSVDCRRIRRRHPRDARVCGPCGGPFWPTRSRQIYCGSVCRRRGHYLANKDRYLSQVRYRKAQLRAVSTEFFTSLEIYERDGWVCGICHQGVDRNLEFPHPWSKSLDHRIPISKGGPHSRENSQLAHLLCNLRKSDSLLEVE